MAWGLLVKEHILNIGLQIHNQKCIRFFQPTKIELTSLPSARKRKTHTSRCCGDFGSKDAFLILAYNDKNFQQKKGAPVSLFKKNYSVFFWYWCFYANRSRDSVSPVCFFFFFFYLWLLHFQPFNFLISAQNSVRCLQHCGCEVKPHWENAALQQQPRKFLKKKNHCNKMERKPYMLPCSALSATMP